MKKKGEIKRGKVFLKMAEAEVPIPIISGSRKPNYPVNDKR